MAGTYGAAGEKYGAAIGTYARLGGGANAKSTATVTATDASTPTVTAAVSSTSTVTD